MRKLSYWLAGLMVLSVTTGLWWDMGGGQHWAAYQTGTYCGSTGVHYCYWSGFGSVFPWVLFSMGGIFAGLAVGLRHLNCHETGCWRMAKYPVAGGEFKVCGKHNPDFDGKRPPRGHIAARHKEYQEKLHLYLGKTPGKG